MASHQPNQHEAKDESVEHQDDCDVLMACPLADEVWQLRSYSKKVLRAVGLAEFIQNLRTAYEDENDKCRQKRNENEENGVVALAHACAQPDAMVIESKHAIVAIVAVTGPQRPKNIAKLAILELGYVSIAADGAIHLGLEVKYFGLWNLVVLVELRVDLRECFFGEKVLWDYTGVGETGY